MKSKYVFFDIDNTLVSHKNHASHIPDATREAIRRLKGNGHVPVIATGRGVFLARHTANDLGIRLMICSSGAHLCDGERTLSLDWLSEAALDGLRKASRVRPEAIAALDEKFIYTENRDEYFAHYFEEQAGYPCIQPLEKMSRAVVGYLLIPPPAPADCEVFANPPKHAIIEPLGTFIELRAEGATKWNGIMRLLDSYGLTADDAIAFGDGLNDIEMLSKAATGVAMSVANDDVRAAADIVADDIDNGGILKACIELGLIQA